MLPPDRGAGHHPVRVIQPVGSLPAATPDAARRARLHPAQL